ncbi:MAG: hypothetical protein RIR47_58 [Bacteroidota bacterium]|jgi:hypothetical protein
MISVGDIVKCRLTNQYGIVIKMIKRESNNGYIVDWFEENDIDDKAIYYSFHLIKVSQ